METSSSVYDVEKSLIASGGSADTVLTGRKRTVLAASLDKLITRDHGRSLLPPPPPMGAGDEHSLIKNKIKFSSYVRKLRGIGCKVIND
jgi:hypothetical protein